MLSSFSYLAITRSVAVCFHVGYFIGSFYDAKQAKAFE